MESNVSTPPKVLITPEEYLALERKAETRSEYLDGEMFPMPGVTLQHVRIVVNLLIYLNTQFRDRTFEALGPELRLKVSRTGLYTYPDVMILGGDAKSEDTHTTTRCSTHASSSKCYRIRQNLTTAGKSSRTIEAWIP